MRYRHVPVAWKHPLSSDLERFFMLMEELIGRQVFIHCAANKRVAVFMALCRQLRQAWEPGLPLTDVRAIWEPDAVWRKFMEVMMQQLGRSQGDV